MKKGKVESLDQAFMANIEVQSKPHDKICSRCVDFVAKCDRYALYKSNLITDLEKARELIVMLSRADKKHRSQVIALKMESLSLRDDLLKRRLRIKI
ncbi:hypothetical protein Hanom_Chr02g00168111 [Helianthus anomalus]